MVPGEKLISILLAFTFCWLLAFVHGAFHWLGLSVNNFVVSFSILNEVYGEIPLTKGWCLILNMLYIESGVSILGGMLCGYSTYTHWGKDTFKLWVMKDYNVQKSWNNLFSHTEILIFRW